MTRDSQIARIAAVLRAADEDRLPGAYPHLGQDNDLRRFAEWLYDAGLRAPDASEPPSHVCADRVAADPSATRLRREPSDPAIVPTFVLDSTGPYVLLYSPIEADASEPAREAGLRAVLALHYVTAIDCDHEAKTDTARCNCSVWTGTPQPSVGAAVDQWIDHVLAFLVAPESGLRARIDAILDDEPNVEGVATSGVKRWYSEGWNRLARDVRAALSREPAPPSLDAPLDVDLLSIAMNRAYTFGTGTAEQVAAHYDRLRSSEPRPQEDRKP